MRIHIIGAGAIGGMAGAWMARHGEDVTFVDAWREHVDAMQREGLRIDGILGPHHLRVRALHPEQLDEPVELAFVAVKSHHTEDAARLLEPYLTSDATVVSLQNGFNAELLAARLGRERVLGTVPDYTAALVDPGRLEYTVVGPVYVGELDGATTPRLLNVQRLLSLLTTTQITPNIVGRIWTKQCYMSWIVMSALVDAPIVEVLRPIRNRLLGVALVRETLPLAARAEVTLERDRYFQPDLLARRDPQGRCQQCAVVQDLIDHFDHRTSEPAARDGYHYVKQGSGMWWDIVYRKRPSETRWITGALVERAQTLGVPLPLNARLADMVYEVERGERPLGWLNLDELATLAMSLDEPLELDTAEST
jgi:2-dehydropantoate 2-reductase